MNRDDDRASTVRALLRWIDLARFELHEATAALRDAEGRVAKRTGELERLTRALEALRGAADEDLDGHLHHPEG